MSFKDQLADDMENVFMNPDELADSVTIDGVATAGFLLEHSGEYEELVNVLKVASNTAITTDSVIIAKGKTYGVASGPHDDGFGSVTVILGTPV
ncbi:MAG: hypothetical protein Q8M39_11260 [Sulfuricurvum sp.]|nr:hypothetical protein [Sulfuricurvum sp.]